ncbi:MAG: hypothetical protein J6A97_04230 [Clostridia bacterium]|nr:hypothetical protein [Clostridia bacterium]
MLFGNGCNSYWILFIILILVLTGDNGCGCNQNNCGCGCNQNNCGCGCN